MFNQVNSIHKSYYIYRQSPNDPQRSKEEIIDAIIVLVEHTVGLKNQISEKGAVHTSMAVLYGLHNLGSRAFPLPQQPLIFVDVVHRIEESPVVISPADMLRRFLDLGLIPDEELSQYPAYLRNAIEPPATETPLAPLAC